MPKQKPVSSKGKGKRRATHDPSSDDEDFADEYKSPFPIHFHEEGKKFQSFSKRNLILPKYFDEATLHTIGLKDDIYAMCAALGWTKFIGMKFNVYYKLVVEFYTTFKEVDRAKHIYSCRFFRKPYQLDYDLVCKVFGFRKGGLCDRPSEFHLSAFWNELTGGFSYNGGHLTPNDLILHHSYLIIYKFMAQAIFGK